MNYNADNENTVIWERTKGAVTGGSYYRIETDGEEYFGIDETGVATFATLAACVEHAAEWLEECELHEWAREVKALV